MKYICVEKEDGKQEIIVFPKTIDHDVMAESVGRMKNSTYGNWKREWRTPVSAGFVTMDWKCYGRSETLDLDSRPEEDTEILQNHFPFGG
jgi:hypothetical protein